MDNTNTNWPNNPVPTQTNEVNPPQDPAAPVSPWPATPSPLLSSPSLTSQPTPPATSINSTWTPPPTPIPEPFPVSTNTAPQLSSLPSSDTLSTWPSTIPTSIAPSSAPPINPQSTPDPVVNSSLLDNPWGAPTQPPPIDGSAQNSQPTWTPPLTTPPSIDSATPTGMPTEQPTSPASDSIPTDLSHLISNNNPSTEPSAAGTNGLPLTSAETLVIPSTSVNPPDVPTVTAQEHKGIPKWLTGVGLGLLVMVAGASAYFILGVGQSPKTTTSVPAEVTPKQVVKTAPPIATPIPQTNPVTATSSANFGELQGSGTTSPQASSAAELLKQRQQQAR